MVKPENVISFGSRERDLALARAYIADSAEAMRSPEEVASVLFRALKPAEPDLKLQIVLMMGALASSHVIRPLYKIMHDSDESESVRYAAAVQLSILGGTTGCAEELVRQLKEDLLSTDSFTRTLAAFALGWENNQAAVPALIDCLYDPDPDVQQAAADALANVRHGCVLDLLLAHIASGTNERKRCILYHLHHFAAYRPQIAAMFSECLKDPDPNMRHDALLAIGCMTDRHRYAEQVVSALRDEQPRLRELALQLLAELRTGLKGFEQAVRPLLNDPDAGVRRAAVKLMHPISMSVIR